MVEHVVIMAGGSGTRLWPASRAGRPKQFLDVGLGRSLFQATLQRSLALEPQGQILVVTHHSQVDAMQSELRGIDAPRGKIVILPEPVARNTAPAIMYACAYLKARGARDQSLVVLASDHIIDPTSTFAADVERAEILAGDGRLVVFGVPTTGPETGYGYIESADPSGPGYLVESFQEKPDEATAKTYHEDDRFYWNSGMFVFGVDTFLEEIGQHAADVADAFAGATFQTGGGDKADLVTITDELKSIYESLPSISIDYAVMEKSRRVAMVRTEFSWSDVGSWDEVARLNTAGTEAPIIRVESPNNFVYSDIPVALAGVSNLIVVIKDGVALVCRRGASQLVRGIVDQIKEGEDSALL